jgi:DNA-binding winged helix-turn-helix (wHTH) protein/TolB-like protein
MDRIRFGVFDFDPRTGELRREGMPVHLQSQPAQVLGILLDKAGEIVTRESLREAVWSEGTFVDFDRGLNFCVAQIRSALGDSAESPRYIKTLPKRGYQFITPVHSPDVIEVKQPSRRWMVMLPIAVAAGAGAGYLTWKRVSTTALPAIAVARFDNETGIPEMDRLAEGLTDTLVGEMTGAGAGMYSIIGNASILLQPRSFRDVKMIGEQLHVAYVVLGQVQKSSNTARVLAHLIRVPEQTHLAVARIDFDPSDPLQAQLSAAKQIATTFHQKLTGLTITPKSMNR